MKYIKHIHMNYIVIFLFALIVYIFPQYTSAVAVPINYTSYGVNNYTYGNIELVTTLSMSLDKQFILQAQNIKNLALDESGAGDIPVGVNLLAYNYDATGSYNYFKGDWGTPPMDGSLYTDPYPTRLWTSVIVGSVFRGDITKQLGYTLSSSNNGIIDCASSGGTSCRTVGQGTATVTVSFPDSGSYYVQRAFNIGTEYYETKGETCTTPPPVCYPSAWWWLGVKPTCVTSPPVCGCESGWTAYNQSRTKMCRKNTPSVQPDSGGSLINAYAYTLSPISYTIRVKNPNQPPTVAYTGTTSIGYNTATANWSYSDVDGDPQVWSHVQIATDSGFSNIIASPYQNSSANNQAISGLIPGTTYYPRVAVYNAVNGWTGYVNGPAFTTLANNPPNLGEFSCSGTPTGYNTAQVNWNYTGSDPDALELTLKYIKLGDPAWTSVNLPGNRTGTQNIASLIPGETYAVRIEVIDQYNTHLRGDWVNRWKDCGNVRANPYPEPDVTFNLTGGGNTVGPGGTLIVNTEDTIRADWKITDTDGLDRCRITTTGIQDIFTIDPLVADPLNPLRTFVGGRNETPKPYPNDQNYEVRLICDARIPANPERKVEKKINVTIRSRPVIICTVNNRGVSTQNPIVTIVGEVKNAPQLYDWRISRNGNNDASYSPIKGNPSPGFIPNLRGNVITEPLDYTGLAFGKYTPWLEVTASNGRMRRQSCGQISNLGNRVIREVNP